MNLPNNADSIRHRLETRRSDLSARKVRVERDLAREHEPLSPDFADQATQVENDEALQAIERAAAQEISEIDEALYRLNQGAYGTCKHCGKTITAQRLAAVPHAVSCTDCPAQ
jgi:RNA polymerase-binding protein DksA